ncbi:MAG: hypothetical protein HYY17_09665 [Planctomycetes bacterium]|nr:hypothetical protein [Planctomycetota bacterium]
MTCVTNDVLLDLSERRLAGELSDRVETHLLDCDACRARFGEIRAIASAVRRCTGTPDALLSRLDGGMAEILARPRRRRLAVPAAIAAALAVAALVYLAAPDRPMPPPPPALSAIAAAPPLPRAETEIRTERRSPASEAAVVTDARRPAEDATPDLPWRPARPGDVNGDGLIDVADRLVLARYLAGRTPAPDPAVADLNGDGAIDVGDVQILTREIARGR